MTSTTVPVSKKTTLPWAIQWLIEPSESMPPIQRRQARLMSIFLLALILASFLYLFLHNFTSIYQSDLKETISVTVTLIVTYMMSRRGYWKLAGSITIIFIYMSLLLLVITGDDPLEEVDVLAFVILPLLISSIFFSAKSVIYVAVFFSLGELSLPIFAPPITYIDLLSGTLALLWTATIVIYIASRHRDEIEAERQTELALSENRFRQMAENIREVFWTYDLADDRVSYVSPAYDQVMGNSISTFYKDPLSILNMVHPDDLPLAEYAIREFMGGNSVSIEVRITRPDNSPHWVWARGFPISDDQNKVKGVAGIISDITERKLAQEKIEEVNQTLEQRVQERTKELVIANVALDKAARMKDEFLAGMSHELRTPLTGILGFSEALQLRAYGELNEKQHKAVKTIEESGRHLLELINDILDLAKIEAGKLELQFGSYSIEDICQASLKLTKGMAQKKRHQFHVPTFEETIHAYVDARRIKQVLVNLISNAVKFTPENGEIGLDVQADRDGQKIKLTVWDKGIGIKPEDLHNLFRPFTQIDSSLAREYSGTGLGLSLVYRLVELHNGGIEVESTFGEGSRFTISLPWSPENTPPIPHALMELPGMLTSNAQIHAESSNTPLILVADDNAVVLQMLADFLEMQGYRVIKVSSGVELLERVSETPPDLMLVDIQMPRMDGLETIRRIRSNKDTAIAAIPVIAVTALAMPGDRERCLNAGANEYVSKPLKLNELTVIIKKHLLKK